ncbi:hypothetical protein HBH70_118080 [Parastagonospora nodorum]|nr:hypothetical protein HBH53_176940 [Parastagonospora nodorum]KAH4029337.1 hypothetical protein HBI09_132010 [Parastagonospora nodorum]KAH4063906.1 hypothetical protein HBH50_188220 [Parastagonospora nodorum]KAH4079589.1 hypothetical protein HBH48_216000 [Parastagonospora nodorum]KAH4164727.1 hypothetical protein HBH43_144680 [Parastagonospora nodorum]
MVEMDTTLTQTSTTELPRTVPASLEDTTAPLPQSTPHQLDAFVPGYPKIAARMSLIPETAMFRRFGALNARNLLYLQGDLARIEEELVKLEWSDSQSDTGKKAYYASSSKLLGNASVLRDGDVRQRELVERMSDTLCRYNQAIIHQRTILEMSTPDPADVQNMRCFYDSAMMNHGNTLIGADRDVWGTVLAQNSHSPELVVLRPREGVDPFSRALSRYAVPLWEMFAPARWKKPNPRLGVISVREDHVFMTTRWVTGFVAVVMPVLSIEVLKRMEGVEERLLAMAGFSLLMAVCLMGLTEAKRKDVFLVVMVFATMQAIFVDHVPGCLNEHI